MYKQKLLCIAIFCLGTSLKKKLQSTWGLEPARHRFQSTDMLCCRPSCIPDKGCIMPRVKQHY